MQKSQQQQQKKTSKKIFNVKIQKLQSSVWKLDAQSESVQWWFNSEHFVCAIFLLFH